MKLGDDDDARVRLEGRAELLEATVLRYDVLLRHLRSFWWAQRVRRVSSVLREVARVQNEVDEAIARATRHAQNEAWPPRSALLHCLHTVTEQRAQLELITAKRLGEPAAKLTLTERFERLQHQVLTAPRVVLPGGRWVSAHEVLPWPSPELDAIARFAQPLETLFMRPLPLTLTLEEVDTLAATWSAGHHHLETVWKRLEALDLTGMLVRSLRRRARRLPAGAAKSGPEVLLHAEFWRAMANARIDAMLTERVGPVVCRENERWPVLRWLVGSGSLQLDPLSRAALIELARAINSLTRGPFERTGLLELAKVADTARDDADWRRLHDSLAVLVRVLDASNPKPTRGKTPDTLEGLVSRLP